MKNIFRLLFAVFFLFTTMNSLHAQWIQTYSGTFTALAVSGTNIFAGDYGVGIFLSTNNGTSWTAINTGLTNTTVQSLIVSGTNIFAGTNGGGAFLSTNNGTSWRAINTGLTNRYVYALAVSPDGAGDTNLFAGTNGGGVFLSTNNGTSWTAASTGLTTISINALVVSGINLFAGTYGGGVFLSTNNGTNWTSASTGLTRVNVHFLTVSPNGAGGTNLFAGTDGGVFFSINNGTNWTAINNGLTNTTVQALIVSGTNIFAGTNGGVFLSTNNGSSWSAVNNGLTNTNVIALVASGTNLFAGTYGGGVWSRSLSEMISIPNAPTLGSPSNGATGVQNSSSLTWNASSGAESYQLQLATNQSFSNTIVDKSNITSTSYVIGGLADNTTYYWRINAVNAIGNSWSTIWSFTTQHGQWIKTSLTSTVRDIAISGTNIFTVAVDSSTFPVVNGVFLSTDNGTSWRSASTTNLTSAYVLKLVVSGNNIFAGAEYGVFLSSDNGISWISTGFPNTDITALAVFGTNIFANSYYDGMYISTDYGKSWKYTLLSYPSVIYDFAISGTNIFAGGTFGVILSINNGATWGSVNTGLTNAVNAFAVSGTNIFAGTDGGVFLNTNNGKSWIAAGLTSAHVNHLAASGTNIFAGTNDGGVFLSNNNGTSWTAINIGLPKIGFNAIAVAGTNVFVGCDSGLYRRPLAEMITAVNEIKSEIPASFSLSQNYPNPFNSSTTISFNIPNKSYVSLKIFDLLGKEVSTILSEEMSTGSYFKQWNAENMTSGVYFYRLQAGAFTETKKLVLLR